MIKYRACLFLLLVSSICAGERASAGLFSSEGLDPAFCNLKTVRQTVVYIDDLMMEDGRIEWAEKLLTKLKASLMPGERVTVVRLSSETGRSTEIWSGCWAAYTPEQKAAFAKEVYFLSQSPLAALADQQKFFARDFGVALTKIYSEAKRPESEVAFAIAKAPPKQILRALASDEGRFSNSQMTIRAIIYSDMIENSDLASVLKPLPSPMPNFAEKLGSRLRRAVFYAFGVAEDVTDGRSVQDDAKNFWVSVLKSLSGTVGGFGADLNVSNQVPARSFLYDTQLKFADQVLDGKLSLLVDADGNLVDSWVGFSRLSIAGLSGTFRCRVDNCRLDGTTTSGIATSSPTELVRLSGKNAELSGMLGIDGTKTMFELTATLEN